jgi:shikimate kinase
MTDSRSHGVVCLSGFMGSGKSTVARLLARQVGWVHVDLDQRIVDSAHQTIPEIFSKRGEAEFRKMEHDQLSRIFGEATEQRKPRVVSLGGGTVVQPRNQPLFKLPGVTLIWLHCPVDVLLSRIAHIQDRPLFRDEASFRKLYAERLPYYEAADFKVDSSVEPLRVVEQIVALGVFPKVNA